MTLQAAARKTGPERRVSDGDRAYRHKLVRAALDQRVPVGAPLGCYAGNLRRVRVRPEGEF